DGSHAVATYAADSPTRPQVLTLRHNMDGYICGMVAGLWSMRIGDHDCVLLATRCRFIREGTLLGTRVIDGRRCAVVEYFYPDDSPWHCVLAVNPDYFVVRDSMDGNGKVYRTLSWHNISTEPIPDDVWE
ncbi:MAG: hypothetical protein ABII12_18205, partial [Planctomycetota bacterium]